MFTFNIHTNLHSDNLTTHKMMIQLRTYKFYFIIDSLFLLLSFLFRYLLNMRNETVVCFPNFVCFFQTAAIKATWRPYLSRSIARSVDIAPSWHSLVTILKTFHIRRQQLYTDKIYFKKWRVNCEENHFSNWYKKKKEVDIHLQ